MNKKPMRFPAAAFLEQAGPAPEAQQTPEAWQPPEAQQPPVAQNSESVSEAGRAVYAEALRLIAPMLQSGELPKDFDVALIARDQAFMQLLREFPPKAAMRIYIAEYRAKTAEQRAMEDIASRMRARQSLPQAARTGSTMTPERDYAAMTADDFQKSLHDARAKTRNGIRVKL